MNIEEARGTVKVSFKDGIIAKIVFDNVRIQKAPEVKDIKILMLKGEDGTTNYNELTNKPQINGVTLIGDKSSEDLDIDVTDGISNSEIEALLKI